MASASLARAFAKSSGRDAGTNSLLRMRRSTALRPARPSRVRRPLPRHAQPLDLLVGVAEPRQDLPRVLPQLRRGEGGRGGSGAEVDRMRHAAVAPDASVLEAREDAFRGHLRMVEHVLDRARRRAGDALAEQRFPFERGARLEGRADPGHDLAGVLGPLPHRVEARIARELGQTGQLAQRRPEMRRVGGDVEAAAASSDAAP